MAYSDFTTITAVKKQFHLTIDESCNLFETVPALPLSDHLQTTLDENIPLALAIATEKARSEMIIAPILIELRKLANHKISLFSGIDFTIDPDKGLNGVCDFIISGSPEQFVISLPVMVIVEAKNEDIKRGISQCISEMVAAQAFNLREGNQNRTIYGVVTTGSNWRFISLTENTAFIDLPEYFINQAGKILGIFWHIISE